MGLFCSQQCAANLRYIVKIDMNRTKQPKEYWWRKNVFICRCVLDGYLQVKLTKNDIDMACKGVAPNKVFDTLFTKDYKLKRPVGKAQKSWKLVSLRGSTASSEDIELAVKDIISGNRISGRFTFERQKLWLNNKLLVNCLMSWCSQWNILDICSSCLLWSDSFVLLDCWPSFFMSPIAGQWFVNSSSMVRQWLWKNWKVQKCRKVRQQFVNGSSVRQWSSSIVRQCLGKVRQYWRIDEPLTNYWRIDELLTNYFLCFVIYSVLTNYWRTFDELLTNYWQTINKLLCSDGFLRHLRKTMDELIPMIFDKKVKLKQHSWCYTHERECRRGVDACNNPDILNMLLLGSPCVEPWSGSGSFRFYFAYSSASYKRSKYVFWFVVVLWCELQQVVWLTTTGFQVKLVL